MSEEAGKALKYAFRLLSYRGRSENELFRRLRMKGFGPEAIESAVQRLRESGYVDDETLSQSLKRRAEEVKFLGLGGARLYLREMGIPKDVADDALKGYNELESAMRLVESRRRVFGGISPAVVRRRINGQLRRRGHSAGTVRKALESLKRKGRT